MGTPSDAIEIKLDQKAHPLDLQTGKRHRIIVDKEVIPIIFVPGIMGSRLRNNHGSKVWDPDALWFMRKQYRRKGPEARRTALLGEHQFTANFLDVYEDDQDNNVLWLGVLNNPKPIKTTTKEALAEIQVRGWGGIARFIYWRIIAQLHAPREPLSDTFDLPVYAVGYNWTASNRASGERLKRRIAEIMKIYTDLNRTCKHVILVTHSMGGLVARAACKLFSEPAESKVLGVIHVAQPAVGAAVAYWRMKAGFEQGGEVSEVLGPHGRDVSAVLGSMPGGLELLPNAHYARGSPWLSVLNADGTPFLALPKHHQPYREIYKRDDRYWGLAHPEYIEPRADKRKSAVSTFRAILDRVEKFQNDLGFQQHPVTHHVYIVGSPTMNSCTYKLQPNAWRCSPCHDSPNGPPQTFREPSPLDPKMTAGKGKSLVTGAQRPPPNPAADLAQGQSSYEGKFSEFVPLDDNRALEIQLNPPPTEAGEGTEGDGTVPLLSASALADNQHPGHRIDSRKDHTYVFDDNKVIDKVLEIIRTMCKEKSR